MALSHPNMTWLQLVLLGAVAFHGTCSLGTKLDYDLDVINPDAWPGLDQVPADVLARAAFVVIGGGDGDGTDVLVHTTDSRTYVYGYYGNGEKTELQGIRMKDATMGMVYWSYHVFFLLLTDGGEVYTAGENHHRQLGYNTSSDSSSVFGKVPGLTNVIQIAAGVYHCVALTQDAEVYYWGYEWGAGKGTSGPVKVNFTGDFTPSHIASGSSHCLVLSKDGQTVMGWGGNEFYNLGLGTSYPSFVKLDQPLAARIPDGVHLRSIHAGYHTTFALDVRGQLWQWGKDYHGALGQGGQHQPTPTTDMPIMKDRAVASLRGMWWSYVAVTEDNEVYRWGEFKDGVVNHATLVQNATDTPLDVLAEGDVSGTVKAARLVTNPTELPITTPEVEVSEPGPAISTAAHEVTTPGPAISTAAPELPCPCIDSISQLQEEIDTLRKNHAEQREHDIQAIKFQMKRVIQTLKDTLTGLTDVMTDNISKELFAYLMEKNFLPSQDVDKSSNGPVPE